MVTIKGKPKKDGVAIAAAAVLDAQIGVGGVSPALLREGIESLKRGLPPEDYPEAVVACENAAMALAMRIPGVSTVGIAAQSEQDAPGVEFEVPCVIGLPDLLTSISEGDILIVDGNKGVVHIDPEPATLIHYQQIEEQLESREKLFIASEHIPAKTQNGETVYVYAHVASEQEAAHGLDEGADGLIAEARGYQAEMGDYCRSLLRAAAGKPVAFVVDFASEELLRAAMHLAAPNQVTVLFSPADFASRTSEMHAALESMAVEAFSMDLVPPTLNLGILARESEDLSSEGTDQPSALVLDRRKSSYLDTRPEQLPGQMTSWIGARQAENVVILLGKQIDAVERVVRAGARAVAVVPDIVSAAKYVIRSIGDYSPSSGPKSSGRWNDNTASS